MDECKPLPSTLNLGVRFVTDTKNITTAATTASILTSRCADPISAANAAERLRVSVLLFSDPRYTVWNRCCANSLV